MASAVAAGCGVCCCGAVGHSALEKLLPSKPRPTVTRSIAPDPTSDAEKKDKELVDGAVKRNRLNRIMTNCDIVVKTMNQVDLGDDSNRGSEKKSSAMTEGAQASSTGSAQELQEVQYENERLRQDMAILTSRKSEIESNLVYLTDRLDKLETTNATLDVAAAPREVSAAAGPAAPGKAREAAVAQLEEALHFADQALQGALMEPRGDAAAGAIPEFLVGAGSLREAFGGLTSATPAVEQRIASTLGLLKERLGIAPASVWGARSPCQDFDVGDTCEGQDSNARWWPVLLTAKNTNGTFACDVSDGFNSKWREVRTESLRQAAPAQAAALANPYSPRMQLKGELEMVQQQLVAVQTSNQSLLEKHREVTDELGDLSGRHRDLTVQHQDLSNQHQDLHAQHQDLHVQHRDLTEAKAASEAEFRRAAQELEALRESSNSTASDQAKELLDLKAQHAELTQVLEDHKRELQEHNQTKQSTTGLLTELQTRVQQQDQQLAELPTLRSQLAELPNVHSEYREQVVVASTRATQLQAQLEEIKQSHLAEQQMLKEQHEAQIEIQCAAAAKEAAARAMEFAQLEENPNIHDALIDEEREMNRQLRSQLGRAEEQLSAFREREKLSEKLQKERDDMRNRLVAATRKLEDVSRSAAASAAAVQMPFSWAAQRNSNPATQGRLSPGSAPESRAEPARMTASVGASSVKFHGGAASASATAKAPSTAFAPRTPSLDESDMNVSGSIDMVPRAGRIVTPQAQTTTPAPLSNSVSGMQTPTEISERQDRNLDRNISQGIPAPLASPKGEGWRAVGPASPVKATTSAPSLGSSVKTRRASSEAHGDSAVSTVTVTAPRNAAPPPSMSYQASPMRSTSGDFPAMRSPPQPGGPFMAAMPKPQVRYVSPGPASGSAPVLTVTAASFQSPSGSSGLVTAAAGPSSPVYGGAGPSSPVYGGGAAGRGSFSPPPRLSPAPQQAPPPKVPFMSAPVFASGFVSPFAFRPGAAKYPGSPPAPPVGPPPGAPQLASNAREVLSRGTTVAFSYPTEPARQHSPAFRFAAS